MNYLFPMLVWRSKILFVNFRLGLPCCWGGGVCSYRFKHFQLAEDRTVLLVDTVRGLVVFPRPLTPGSDQHYPPSLASQVNTSKTQLVGDLLFQSFGFLKSSQSFLRAAAINFIGKMLLLATPRPSLQQKSPPWPSARAKPEPWYHEAGHLLP